MNIFQQSYVGTQGVFQWASRWISRQLEDTKPKNSVAVLDGVRAIACLLVVGYHISLLTFRETHVWVPNDPSHPLFSSFALIGTSGVTLFFVLSGFLLFQPYARSLLFDNKWPSARLFYLRRSFRIIPAYYVCLFLLILISQYQYLQPAHWKELGLFLTFFMDSTNQTTRKLNGPFWTLAVEWQYYLLLPLIAWGINLVARRGSLQERLLKLVFCLGLLIVWGLGTRYAGLYFNSHLSKSFIVSRSTLNKLLFFTYGTSGKYLEDFAVGMLISVAYTFTRNTEPDHSFSVMMRRFSLWMWRLGIIILVFMALWRMDWVFYNTWPSLNGLARSGYWLSYYDWSNEICFAIGYGLCVTAILYGPTELQRPFAWNPLRWVGLISYSMYMWHLPLIGPFLIYFGHSLEGTNYFVVFGIYWAWVLLVIIPFSFLNFVFIEKPGMLFGDKFRPPTEPPKVEAIPILPAPAEPAQVE